MIYTIKEQIQIHVQLENLLEDFMSYFMGSFFFYIGGFPARQGIINGELLHFQCSLSVESELEAIS